MKHFESYIICTSPRSGSTLLCKLLSNTGVAGVPDSHFHNPSINEWLSYYGLNRVVYTAQRDALNAVFTAAYKYGKGDTDVFGLRLQQHSFDFFMHQLSVMYPSLASDKLRVEAAFGKTLFVHLTRENKLDQAISYVKAKQSGLWHRAPDGTELERLSEPRELAYDAKAIAAQLALSLRMDVEWEEWFRAERIEPMRLTYDELSSDPNATLARLLISFGADPKQFTVDALPVAKLADATNLEWAAQYRSETKS